MLNTLACALLLLYETIFCQLERVRIHEDIVTKPGRLRHVMVSLQPHARSFNLALDTAHSERRDASATEDECLQTHTTARSFTTKALSPSIAEPIKCSDIVKIGVKSDSSDLRNKLLAALRRVAFCVRLAPTKKKNMVRQGYRAHFGRKRWQLPCGCYM